MPAYRTVPTRRSERLSQQEPRSYHGDDHDWEGLDLAYPPVEPQADATSASLTAAVSSLSLSGSPDDLSSLFHAPFVPSASHARRRKAGHIPRPPNAFMIFRSDMWRKRKLDPTVERDHRNISVIAGICWKQLSPEEQRIYQVRATLEKQRHALQNPGYKYSPVVRKQKSAKKKARSDTRDDKDKCKKLASLWMRDFEEPARETSMESNATTPTSGAPATTLPTTSRPPSSTSSSTDTIFSSNAETKSPPHLVFYPESASIVAPEFVPTADIPPLDLTDGADVDVPKSIQHFEPNLQPPRFSPSYLDPHFGIKPEAVEFTHSYLLSMNHNNNVVFEEPDFSFGKDYFGDSASGIFSPFISDTPVDVPNVFASQGVINNAAVSLFESQDMYWNMFPTAICDSTSEPREVDFGNWFKFE